MDAIDSDKGDSNSDSSSQPSPNGMSISSVVSSKAGGYVQSNTPTRIPRQGQDMSKQSTESHSELDIKSPSSMKIPQLDWTLTPWRKQVSEAALAKTRTFSAAGVIENPSEIRNSCSSQLAEWPVAEPFEQGSPTGSRPITRNSLFSDEVLSSAAATASVSTSAEIEHLHKQLTNYKLRLRVLTEYVREMDYDSEKVPENTTGLESRRHALDKFIGSLEEQYKPTDASPNVMALQTTIEDKNKEIIALKQELISTKNEYTAVLEDINSYLEHSDVIAANIDEMLERFIQNREITKAEKDALESARNLSPNFLDVKINALSINVENVLTELVHFSQSQLEINGDSSIANHSQLMDSRLENAIEDMHYEYRTFLTGVGSDLEKGSHLQDVLERKIRTQNDLLAEMMQLSQTIHTEISSIKPPSPSDITEDEPILQDINNEEQELSQNAKPEVSSPTIEATDTSVSRVSQDIDSQQSSPVSHKGMQHSISNITDSPKSGDPLSCDRELQSSSNAERKNLWDQIEALKSANANLQKEMEILQAEKSDVDIEAENNLIELEKALKRAVRNSGIFVNENQRLEDHVKKLETTIRSIEQQKTDLFEKLRISQENGSNSKKTEQNFQKLKRHLLLHLHKIFDTFNKILQESSIDQAKNKLSNLEHVTLPKDFKLMHSKLESLYVFIEAATDSIVEEHAAMLLDEKDRGGERSDVKTLKLRIESLEHKWIAERERRRLDSEAAEDRIFRLEKENQILRERFNNISL
ncbi:LAMI_0F05248g1_1 [Lachancea mirantina]|uniref:LAMI_0F05248g1_1 n=1 Tax=Lachancea mirantina TaxID=1230905 RepID=A0A1G4JYI0_9SACH|nr:LAMI_0F05248g1_1 [Lachancea mirantina]